MQGPDWDRGEAMKVNEGITSPVATMAGAGKSETVAGEELDCG